MVPCVYDLPGYDLPGYDLPVCDLPAVDPARRVRTAGPNPESKRCA